GLLGCGEPPFDIGDAGFGERLPAPRGAAAGRDAVDFDGPVLQQAGHRRVDLAVVQRPVVTELLVEGPLEVVTVARAGLQEPQEGVTDGHGEHSTHRVYAVYTPSVQSFPEGVADLVGAGCHGSVTAAAAPPAGGAAAVTRGVRRGGGPAQSGAGPGSCGP